MTRLNYWCIGLFLSMGTVLLAGCGGTDTVQPDQAVVLQPGEGIAAVVIETGDPINDIFIRSPDNGKAPSIEITRAEVGMHLFVYAVPAGSYCLVQYHYENYTISQNDPTHGVCFDVIAGKIAYSGNLSPNGADGRLWVDQNYYWPVFQKMFKEQYPKLASYPIVTP